MNELNEKQSEISKNIENVKSMLNESTVETRKQESNLFYSVVYLFCYSINAKAEKANTELVVLNILRN